MQFSVSASDRHFSICQPALSLMKRYRYQFPAIGMALCFVVVTAAQGFAQASQQERYERSRSYNERTRGLVFRTGISPTFLGEDESLGWYRVEVAPGTDEYVLFDTQAKSREVLFDTEILRSALGKLGAKLDSTRRLRLGELRFTDGYKKVHLAILGSHYIWDRAAKTLQASSGDDVAQSGPGGLEPMRLLRPSTGGEATDIEIVNQVKVPLEVYWVDTSGGRRKYGDLQPGGVFSSGTYEGHVWLLVDAEGDEIAAFRASIGNTTAYVTEETPRPRSMRRPGGGRRGAPASQEFRSPDGKWSVSFEDQNVVLTEVENKEVTRLTKSGSESNRFGGRIWWAPDSSAFVVMRTEVANDREITLVESAPEDQLQPKTRSLDYVKPGDELDHPRPYLFHVDDRASGEEAEVAAQVDDSLFANPYAINRMEWRKDSTEFTFVYNQRGHQLLRVISIDAATREARAVIDETADTFVCYSQKFYLERLESTNEMIWMTERDGWNHLVLVDWSSGQIKNSITSGEWVVREVERVDPEQRQVWCVASGLNPDEDPYHRHLIRVDFDGKNLTRLTQGDGDHRWERSPKGNWLIDTYSRVDLPPVVEIRNATTGEAVVELERGDWSQLLDSGWIPPERFVAKGRDGTTDIHGIIIRPTNFDPTLKYPVLEAIYAGPHSSFTPKAFGRHNGLYQMAEMGFIVVKLDGMGTSNRSKAFHDVCWKNLADSGFPDRKLWIQAAGEEYPEFDLERVGIWGGSAGGQSAMRALLSHGDFYHAAASDCGCHDNRMDKIWWNEQWMGWPVGDHYEEQSNTTDAHRLQGDLLLTVGALDSNVDPSSTMQVVEALIDANKDFELIVFPSGGHGSGSSRYGVRRMKDFFLRSLGDPVPRSDAP